MKSISYFFSLNTSPNFKFKFLFKCAIIDMLDFDSNRRQINNENEAALKPAETGAKTSEVKLGSEVGRCPKCKIQVKNPNCKGFSSNYLDNPDN